MVNANLSLEIIDAAEQSAVLGDTCLVTVKLTNRSTVPQIVNHRMAIGYRDMLARELFAELINIGTGLPAEINVVDYDRNFSDPSDYISLPPEQSLEHSFDLFDWYAPTQPGSYRLLIYYQADEALSHAPANVVNGIYASEPIILHVTSKSEQK